MKLSEKLDKALREHNLIRGRSPEKTIAPMAVEDSVEQTLEENGYSEPRPPQLKEMATYRTVQEGFQHLGEHDIDEDGFGSFTSERMDIDDIRLPMPIGEYVIEDIQRTSGGVIQVQFRKQES